MLTALLAFRVRLSSPFCTLRGGVRFYSIPPDYPVPKRRKVWDSVDEAVRDVKSGDTLLCGGAYRLSCSNICFKDNVGFGLGGIPGILSF
jgi:hypothetical protein